MELQKKETIYEESQEKISDPSPNQTFYVNLNAEQLQYLSYILPKRFSLQIENNNNKNQTQFNPASTSTLDKPVKQIIRESANGVKQAQQSQIISNQPPAGVLSTTKSNGSVCSNSQGINEDQNSQILSVDNLNQSNGQKQSKNTPSVGIKQNLREKRVKTDTQNYYDYQSVSTHNNTSSSAVSSSGATNLVSQFMQQASDEMQVCMKILQQLKSHKSCEPFLLPVDPVAQNCENYFEIVKEPIDLSTIEKQLIDGLYITPAQFNGDVRKIWANSYLYNQKGSPIYRMTTDMDKYFQQLLIESEAQIFKSANSKLQHHFYNPNAMGTVSPSAYQIDPNLLVNGNANGLMYGPGSASVPNGNMIANGVNGYHLQAGVPVAAAHVQHSSMLQLQKQVDLLTEKIKQFNSSQNSQNGGGHNGGKGRHQSGHGHHSHARGVSGNHGHDNGSSNVMYNYGNKHNGVSHLHGTDAPMTIEEKRVLGQQIRSLPAFNLQGVWEIVKEANLGNREGEQLEFDINKLPNDIARKLDAYVKDQIAQITQKQSKKTTLPTATNTSNTNNSSLNNKHQTSNPHTVNNYEEEKAQQLNNNFNLSNDANYLSPKEQLTKVNTLEYSNGVKQTVSSTLSDTDDENDSESSFITDSGDMVV